MSVVTAPDDRDAEAIPGHRTAHGSTLTSPNRRHHAHGRAGSPPA